tara:strand:+ start:1563 stop:2450 length:888 start_codon:yes stop_codon:yes gene_type:complete
MSIDLKKTIHNVTPHNILKQALLLKKYFDIISIDELFNLPERKIDGKVSITFDDGYKNIFNEILNELSKYSIPVTVFLIGNSLKNKPFWRDKIIFLLNNKKYLNEFIAFFNNENKIKLNNQNFFLDTKNNHINSKILDETLDKFLTDNKLYENININLISNADELIKNKFITYGNHTLNHYVMSSLNYEEQKSEILDNKNFLSTLNINTTNIFALPFGTYNDLNMDTIKILKDTNINKVLLCNNKINNKNDYLNYDSIQFLDRLAPSNNIFRLILNIFKNTIYSPSTKSIKNHFK